MVIGMSKSEYPELVLKLRSTDVTFQRQRGNPSSETNCRVDRGYIGIACGKFRTDFEKDFLIPNMLLLSTRIINL